MNLKLTTRNAPFNKGPSRPLQLGWVLLPLALLAASAQASAAVLEGMSYQGGAGGSVDLTLSVDGAVPQPEVFTTESPPRIVLDLADTTSGLEQRAMPVGSGAVDRVVAVDSGDRTRVVVELFRSAPYRIDTTDEGILVSVAGTGGTAVATSGGVAGSGDTRIANVDFRRGEEGQGRVIVALDGPPASVNMIQQGNEVTLHFYNTQVPEDLQQHLDVVDFATPVRAIDTYQEGDDVRVVVAASGEFEPLAYQTEDQYVLEIAQVEAEADAQQGVGLLDEKEYTGERVSLNFQDIEVRSVLQFLADFTGLNIVVSDSVTGNVTLRLQNVPWDQALDIILTAKGLDKRRLGNVIWVAPAEEIRAREQAELAAFQAQQELAPLQTAYIQVNYAKASDIATLLTATGTDAQGMLSARGSVAVDERTNTLLVQDTQANIEGIRELVALLDRPVQQVLIESRVVVASADFTKALGVRFGLSGSYEDSDGNVFNTGGGLDATDALANNALSNVLAGNPSGLPTATAGEPGSGILVPALDDRLNVNLPVASPAGSFGLTILGADYLLDLELSALEAEGRGEVISTPRVITANQQEAVIKQGVEIPYQEATSSGATNVQFKEAVLELRVTPLITPDERVILDLNVHQDNVGEIFTGIGGAQIPSIDTREIQTQVLVDNGETVVLGGIYEQTIRENTTRVPFLGELPGIGALFRNTNRETDKAELLIFVTPKILEESLGGN